MATLVILTTVFLLCPASFPGQAPAPPPVLDLTVPPPARPITSTRGVPGSRSDTPLFLLPLHMRLLSVEEARSGEKRGIIVVVVVRNLSDKPFELPVARDVEELTADRNKDRRVFAFRFRTLCEARGRHQSHTAAVTAASSSDPHSVTVLKPMQEVAVRMFLDVSPSTLSDGRPSNVQLSAEEEELEDGRYFVKRRSTTVSVDISIPSRD